MDIYKAFDGKEEGRSRTQDVGVGCGISEKSKGLQPKADEQKRGRHSAAACSLEAERRVEDPDQVLNDLRSATRKAIDQLIARWANLLAELNRAETPC